MYAKKKNSVYVCVYEEKSEIVLCCYFCLNLKPKSARSKLKQYGLMEPFLIIFLLILILNALQYASFIKTLTSLLDLMHTVPISPH